MSACVRGRTEVQMSVVSGQWSPVERAPVAHGPALGDTGDTPHHHRDIQYLDILTIYTIQGSQATLYHHSIADMSLVTWCNNILGLELQGGHWTVL